MFHKRVGGALRRDSHSLLGSALHVGVSLSEFLCVCVCEREGESLC